MDKTIIVLHWWYIPTAFFLFSIYRFTRPSQGDYDFFTGIDGFLWLGVSLAIILGHYL